MDLRDEILKDIMDKDVEAVITANEGGVIAGVERLKREAKRIGLKIESRLRDGDEVKKGDTVAKLKGNPKQVALAEDTLLGLLSKPSGIATAARKAVELADRTRIVCGCWKKMPHTIKEIVRESVSIGGAKIRIADDFVYLDKNYIRMFGRIKEALRSTRRLRKTKVVQLKGETSSICDEAKEAVEGCADIIMIDTGNSDDIEKVAQVLENASKPVKLAYAGGVRLEDVRKLRNRVDFIDIGRAIIDAPMLDIKMDVVG